MAGLVHLARGMYVDNRISADVPLNSPTTPIFYGFAPGKVKGSPIKSRSCRASVFETRYYAEGGREAGEIKGNPFPELCQSTVL